jgi:hypothetical protein
MKDRSLDSVYVPLKIAFGIVPLVAGLDKFTNLLTDWEKYLSPAVRDTLPIGPAAFMMIVGVIEAAVGLAILTKLTRLGAYVAMAWLVLISIDLVLAGMLDIAVRDLVMAVGAYSLGTVAGLKGLAWLPWQQEEATGILRTHAPSAR